MAETARQRSRVTSRLKSITSRVPLGKPSLEAKKEDITSAVDKLDEKVKTVKLYEFSRDRMTKGQARITYFSRALEQIKSFIENYQLNPEIFNVYVYLPDKESMTKINILELCEFNKDALEKIFSNETNFDNLKTLRNILSFFVVNNAKRESIIKLWDHVKRIFRLKQTIKQEMKKTSDVNESIKMFFKEIEKIKDPETEEPIFFNFKSTKTQLDSMTGSQKELFLKVIYDYLDGSNVISKRTLDEINFEYKRQLSAIGKTTRNPGNQATKDLSQPEVRQLSLLFTSYNINEEIREYIYDHYIPEYRTRLYNLINITKINVVNLKKLLEQHYTNPEKLFEELELLNKRFK